MGTNQDVKQMGQTNNMVFDLHFICVNKTTTLDIGYKLKIQIWLF